MSYIPNTYTVEDVTKGHPDRVCDRIADAILYAYQQTDPLARVAIEVFATSGYMIIGGEVTAKLSLSSCDIRNIAHSILQDLDYHNHVKIDVRINTQSTEIAGAVDKGGAGDQGIMYGFACDETPEFFPLGIALTRRIIARLENARESGEIPWLLPDGKVQVTIRNGNVDTVLLSTQHEEGMSLQTVRKFVHKNIILPELAEDGNNPRILINPAGLWSIGGFVADTGLTGRKLSCDTYGGLIPHGGGSSHGKDLTKVDHSAAMAARKVAVEIIKSGNARECLLSVAYAIGVEEPLMLTVLNEDHQDISNLIDKKIFNAKNLV